MGRVSFNPSRLLAWVVVVALLITTYVVVIGGVVCVRDDDYTFAEYVADLGSIYRLLATAVIGAIAHTWLAQQNEKGEVDGK